MEEKVTAAQAAGFDQIELWRQDVEAFAQGAGGLKTRLETLHLGLTDYQPLLDFDGAPPNRRDGKRQEAETMLDTAVKVGAPTLLTPASTDPNCDPGRVVGDMRWLARTAAARGLRVAYEAMAWSSVNSTLVAAWDVVRHVDEPNLGVVVDAFHIFVRGRTAADLDGVPTDHIFLVQLSDLEHGVDLKHVIAVARHHRLLPAQGHFPLATLTDRLKQSGYSGPIGLEVFNDDLKARDSTVVAGEAMASLRKVWPGA
jgi:4-hydroxyphenylpyruvate dioxygenase